MAAIAGAQSMSSRFVPHLHRTRVRRYESRSLRAEQNSKNIKIYCTVAANPSVLNLKRSKDRRQTTDYPPPIWDYKLLESLAGNSDYLTEQYRTEHERLIPEVKGLIERQTDPLTTLELIDTIERLGLKRHFRNELSNAAETVVTRTNRNNRWLADDLHTTALCFRILRQYGYHVSEDLFEKFRDETGNFSKGLTSNVEGLLSLYEASFLGWEGDEIVDAAVIFAENNLKQLLRKGHLPPIWIRKVERALNMPLHRRLARLEARWFIDTYEQQGEDHNANYKPLLRLAKLDYNFVQSAYKEEVRKLARWWKDLDIASKLPHARDRLMEHYLWAVGMVEEPQYNRFREMATQLICLISMVDDTYDNYGTLEELKPFTRSFRRWDLRGVENLPESMRICFRASYHTSNEIAHWVLKEKGFNVSPHMNKAWTDFSKTSMIEATWLRSGYKPTLEEYLGTASISIGGAFVLLLSHFLTAKDISEEALNYISKLPKILRNSSIIFRLTNDIGTSSDESKRGDTLKAIQCYMNEEGVSEGASRKHIKDLIHKTWKKLNKNYFLGHDHHSREIFDPFLRSCLNLARTSHFFYQNDIDGHGKPCEMKHHINLLLFKPFHIDL